ncbi:MAG: saccharopine dehydrogenase NADP-binding domain-containing protein [Pirellulales bacterium]|nr:saccharopine dehydrogenase NADP-binding domain-containing protein [Pirellulales bacterium]
MNHRVLLLGAGKIGRMIARLLVDSGDYDVVVADLHAPSLERISARTGLPTVLIDAGDRQAILNALQGKDTVVSALSFRHNPLVSEAALAAGVNYFDLTEDHESTRRVREVAAAAKPGQIFMPQCGLAPGFISIVAYHLGKYFDQIATVRMRVGALPQFPTGSLKYNLTWSTDGLINEYCNPCDAIHNGQRMTVLPLEGLESFSLDGVRYEAFNTSGGLGTLAETLAGRVRELNYKTVRYLGHRDPMNLLVNELRLSQRRDLLKEILETALPITYQDVVVTFCSVTGYRKGELVQRSDARKIYHAEIDGEHWSAIQLTTASGLCAVLDLYLEGKLANQGFVRQEDVDFDQFMNNRFGKRYASTTATRFSTV